MAKPRKARVEGAAASEATPVVETPKKAAKGDNSDALRSIRDAFVKDHADKWESIALCPTQHGLDIMIDVLK